MYVYMYVQKKQVQLTGYSIGAQWCDPINKPAKIVIDQL